MPGTTDFVLGRNFGARGQTYSLRSKTRTIQSTEAITYVSNAALLGNETRAQVGRGADDPRHVAKLRFAIRRVGEILREERDAPARSRIANGRVEYRVSLGDEIAALPLRRARVERRRASSPSSAKTSRDVVIERNSSAYLVC